MDVCFLGMLTAHWVYINVAGRLGAPGHRHKYDPGLHLSQAQLQNHSQIAHLSGNFDILEHYAIANTSRISRLNALGGKTDSITVIFFTR